MSTLHGYILRELLKTFALSLTGLTVLFTIGGGVWNTLRTEGIGAGDVGGFLPLLLPVAVTLTMPVAALFSVTMVYGRLSADNELLACRAAGINVHTTLLSAFLLSVFVTCFTLLMGGFVIPGFVQRLEDFVRSNVGDFVAQHLRQQGFIYRAQPGQDRYTFTVERVQEVADQALRAKGFEVADNLHYLFTRDPVFLQIDSSGRLVRFISGRYALCAFDARGQGLGVTAYVRDGQDYEFGRQMIDIEEQQVGLMGWKLVSMKRLSFAAFSDLLHWYQAPWDAPRLCDDIDHFLAASMQYGMLVRAHDLLAGGEELMLSEGDLKIRLRCDSAELRRKSLELAGVVAAVRTRGRTTVYEAQQATISTSTDTPGASRGPLLWAGGVPKQRRLEVTVRLEATPEQAVREHSPTLDEPRRAQTTAFDFSLPPEEILPDAEAFTRANVVNEALALPASAELARQRQKLQEEAGRTRNQVIANLNFRLGISASALVTLIMGAALGVIFRGARALAAFALGLIPFFVVLVLMVLGRQIIENPETPDPALGSFVIWGGLAGLALVDLVTLRLGVRR
jgi:lipopolysaccharide export LptBFGC system permease protein LptF